MDPGQNLESSLKAIPLLNAVLCADCEVISNSVGEVCAVCGSRSLLSVGKLLGGSVGGERAVVLPEVKKDDRKMFTLLVNPDAAKRLRAPHARTRPEQVKKLGS